MISLLLTLELSPDEPHGASETRPPLQLDPSPDQLPTTNLIPVHKLIRVSSKPRFLFGIDTHFYKLFAKNLFGFDSLARWMDPKAQNRSPPGQTDLPSSVTLKISDAAKVSFVVL